MVSEVINLPASPVETATDMLSVGNNVGHPTRHRDVPVLENNVAAAVHQPSTSSIPYAKMIKFNIQYGDRVVPISMLDTGTVGECQAPRSSIGENKDRFSKFRCRQFRK